MRIVALDIGEKRVGVAISDPSATIATPLKVVDAASVTSNPHEIVRIVEEYEAELVLVGMPLSLDGTEGPQARRVREVGERLARFLPIPVEYYDERLSSTAARRAMSSAGVSDKEKRGSVDMVAAAVFLQSYLDARRASDAAAEQ